MSSHAVAYKNAAAETLRASAFQEACHPESIYLGKTSTAQLTRIGRLLTGYFPCL